MNKIAELNSITSLEPAQWKQMEISGTTGATGNLALPFGRGKVPVCAQMNGTYMGIPFLASGTCYLKVFNWNNNTYACNVTVSGSVFYIEK